MEKAQYSAAQIYNWKLCNSYLMVGTIDWCKRYPKECSILNANIDTSTIHVTWPVLTNGKFGNVLLWQQNESSLQCPWWICQQTGHVM